MFLYVKLKFPFAEIAEVVQSLEASLPTIGDPLVALKVTRLILSESATYSTSLSAKTSVSTVEGDISS